MLVGLVGLTACDHSNPGTDATHIPKCTDLSGSWQFTGTQTATSQRSVPPLQPETSYDTDAVFAVSLQMTDCTLTGNFEGVSIFPAAEVSGSTASGPLAGASSTTSDYHGTFLLSGNPDGTLHLQSTVSWDRQARNGDQGSISEAGTLAVFL